MSLVTFGEHTVLSFTVEGLKVISNVMRIIFMTRFVSKRVILLFSQANEYVVEISHRQGSIEDMFCYEDIL